MNTNLTQGKRHERVANSVGGWWEQVGGVEIVSWYVGSLSLKKLCPKRDQTD